MEAAVYDLAKYPAAASKKSGVEEFHEIAIGGDVYVMYEYGERDADEDFHRSDITWCQVWVERDPGKLELILDDETA